MRSLKWLLPQVRKIHVKTCISVIIIKMLPIFEPDVKKQDHFTFLGALQNKWLQYILFYYDDIHHYMCIHIMKCILICKLYIYIYIYIYNMYVDECG